MLRTVGQAILVLGLLLLAYVPAGAQDLSVVSCSAMLPGNTKLYGDPAGTQPIGTSPSRETSADIRLSQGSRFYALVYPMGGYWIDSGNLTYANCSPQSDQPPQVNPARQAKLDAIRAAEQRIEIMAPAEEVIARLPGMIADKAAALGDPPSSYAPQIEALSRMLRACSVDPTGMMGDCSFGTYLADVPGSPTGFRHLLSDTSRIGGIGRDRRIGYFMLELKLGKRRDGAAEPPATASMEEFCVARCAMRAFVPLSGELWRRVRSLSEPALAQRPARTTAPALSQTAALTCDASDVSGRSVGHTTSLFLDMAGKTVDVDPSPNGLKMRVAVTEVPAAFGNPYYEWRFPNRNSEPTLYSVRLEDHSPEARLAIGSHGFTAMDLIRCRRLDIQNARAQIEATEQAEAAAQQRRDEARRDSIQGRERYLASLPANQADPSLLRVVQTGRGDLVFTSHADSITILAAKLNRDRCVLSYSSIVLPLAFAYGDQKTLATSCSHVIDATVYTDQGILAFSWD